MRKNNGLQLNLPPNNSNNNNGNTHRKNTKTTTPIKHKNVKANYNNLTDLNMKRRLRTKTIIL